MARPFRFGIQLHSLPLPDWEERVRLIERLGYSTVFWPDHFGTQWDPVAGLAAAAVATERINVGSLVYGVDYRRNPWPQIAWGLQYVERRYGSPCAAWKRFRRGGGY